MAHRTTLRDIAKAIGISVTTVSLVLNDRPARVSETTRRQIMATARKLNYVPNQNARSLVTNTTMLVALIVPDIENLYFASLSRCIEEACQKEGYSLLIANSDDVRSTERELIQRLTGRDVDGLLLIPSAESYAHERKFRTELEAVPCPVTLIDRLVTASWCDGVGFDNIDGGRLAADCLLSMGHRRIGCVTGDALASTSSRRWQGFEQALREAGVPMDPALQVMGDYRLSSGYRAADQLIDHGATAVFCCNDLMALGLLNRLQERGLHCPQDMSVIGYDNILPRFGLLTEVTTVEQNIERLAEHSWATLFERISDGVMEGRPWLEHPRTTILRPRLVDNGTVCPPRPA